MDDDKAVLLLISTVKTLTEQGYVLNGEISLVKPKQAGLTDTHCKVYRLPCPRLELKTVLAGVAVAQPAKAVKQEESNVALGETCSHCGGCRFQRTGVCKVCLDCGTSGGCS